MKINKPTVTIGIPAYNEQEIITRSLESISKQVLSSYILSEVIIISDGSSDRTIEKIKSCKSNLPIKIVQGKNRLGKMARLGQIYKMSNSDYVVNLDADIIFNDAHCVEKLLDSLANTKADFAYGNKTYFKPKTIFGAIAFQRETLWSSIRNKFNGGQNIYNCSGSLSALTKKLSKDIKLPKGISSDNQFLYLEAKREGFKVTYANNALIYTGISDNMRDFFRQNLRLRDEKKPILDFFNQDLSKEYNIPFKTKVIPLLSELVRHPLLSTIAIILDIVLKLLPEKNEGPLWEIAKSTKKIYEN